MTVAVAKRPVEQFQTEVTLPEWQLEADEEAYFGNAEEALPPGTGLEGADRDPMDQAGEDRIESPDTNPPPKMDQRWIDDALGREKSPPPADPPN